MTNGNNGAPNETNPLSPYIRPLAAIFFGLAGLVLVGAGGVVALKSGNWQIFFGLTVVALVPVFWFFNIRGGEKSINKMVDMFNLGTNGGVAKKEPPKAEGQAQVASFEPSQPEPAIIKEPPAEFDVTQFHAEVERDANINFAGELEGEEPTPLMLFMQAISHMNGVECDNLEQAQDAWNYLVDLAIEGENWLREQEEATWTTGCRRYSPEYRDIKKRRDQIIRDAGYVAQLANSRIDWKTKLGDSFKSLWRVGVLAKEMLKYA